MLYKAYSSDNRLLAVVPESVADALRKAGLRVLHPNCHPFHLKEKGPQPQGQHLPSKKTLAKRQAKANRRRQ